MSIAGHFRSQILCIFADCEAILEHEYKFKFLAVVFSVCSIRMFSLFPYHEPPLYDSTGKPKVKESGLQFYITTSY